MEMEESGSPTSGYITKLHKQDSIILAQRKKYGSMEQGGKPREKPMHLWNYNTLCNTIHENKLKMVKALNVRR